MKITKEYLKMLIKEEISKINESNNEVAEFIKYLSKKLPQQDIKDIIHDYNIDMLGNAAEEPDEFSASVEDIKNGLRRTYKLNPGIIRYIEAFKI